jgi:hypothetical protein
MKVRDEVRWKWVILSAVLLLITAVFLLYSPLEYLTSPRYRNRGATFTGLMALFSEYPARYLIGLPLFAAASYGLVSELFVPEEPIDSPRSGRLRGRPSRVKKGKAEQAKGEPADM